MSGWGWNSVFGGNSATPKEVPKNAILGLRGTLDMLEKRERHLQQQMDEQDNIARKNVTANKTGKHHMRSGDFGEAKLTDGWKIHCGQRQKQPSDGKKPTNTASSRHPHR